MMARNDANQRKTNSSMCLALGRQRPPARRPSDGFSQGSRHGKLEFKAAWEALPASNENGPSTLWR